MGRRVPAEPPRCARPVVGEGAPAAGSGFAKRWAHSGHFSSREEEEGTQGCRELAEEEEKEGGVETWPALEEEEGDVEGGSGRVEGLFKKRGNLPQFLKAPS